MCIQHQKTNRERFYFKRSRFFTKTDSESNEEHWINIDEYENREAYERMWKAIGNQPDLPYSNDQEKASQLRKEKRSLTVDHASRGLFTERPELAIDYKTLVYYPVISLPFSFTEEGRLFIPLAEIFLNPLSSGFISHRPHDFAYAYQ